MTLLHLYYIYLPSVWFTGKARYRYSTNAKHRFFSFIFQTRPVGSDERWAMLILIKSWEEARSLITSLRQHSGPGWSGGMAGWGWLVCVPDTEEQERGSDISGASLERNTVVLATTGFLRPLYLLSYLETTSMHASIAAGHHLYP